MDDNNLELSSSNISGSALASSDKLLPEPILTQIYVAMWRQKITKSYLLTVLSFPVVTRELVRFYNEIMSCKECEFHPLS